MRATPNVLLGEYPTVTLDEATMILAISRSMLFNILKERQIPTTKLGRRVMIPTEEIKKLLVGGSTA